MAVMGITHMGVGMPERLIVGLACHLLSRVRVVDTPETVAEHPSSQKGSFLKQVLEQHPPEVVAG